MTELIIGVCIGVFVGILTGAIISARKMTMLRIEVIRLEKENNYLKERMVKPNVF